MQISEIVEKQRAFFHTGATLSVKFRLEALKKLKACIQRYDEEIAAAVKADLGKSKMESYMVENGLVLSEISYMLKHTRSYAREKTVWTPLAHFASRSFKKPSPYGVVLIMSPWNYPFMLALEPMVDALAAGNTVVLKPSAYSPHTSAIIEKIIGECFPAEYVSVVSGGRKENQALLQEHFDYIFFTGSQAVGREVMQKASVHLTPVTLELGGKSPCIIMKDANLKLAAKRFVFGKLLNCGQTCVAPDYIYCHESVRDAFVEEVKKQLRKQGGEDCFQNPDYGKIINEKHFQRVSGLIDQSKVVYGGQTKPETLQIAPTVMTDVTWEDAVMQEEIFGPLVPVLTFTDTKNLIEKLHTMQEPLAFYVFTSSKKTAKQLMSACSFGGGCINDTIIHLATSEMGFGGVGASGMGAYHGRVGFDTFTHYKSIVDKKTWLDLPMRYQPYKRFYDKLIHIFLR
ncbi:MAG: aldehyde dehydrogenase [Lachnospiraceae bacterium]|nr:aldehyde dehydrogenase [Lachnospiraceae bacterium]